MNEITNNIAKINKYIKISCQKAKRKPEDIKILVATKGRSPEQINSILAKGLSLIGENRVQELKNKLPFLSSDLTVDFIGRLQTNKVKQVVRICNLIHSVDSFNLAKKIDKEARTSGKIQKILLEINICQEESKTGFSQKKLMEVIDKILPLKNIKVLGLMTMAPEYEDPEETREVFKRLKALKEEIENKFKIILPELSIGMSNDYSIAIEEGATIIRLGRAIFG